MSEWMDIESAPKDGTKLLLYDAFMFVGSWEGSLGWWDGHDYCCPTHWMPLPPPPGDGER